MKSQRPWRSTRLREKNCIIEVLSESEEEGIKYRLIPKTQDSSLNQSLPNKSKNSSRSALESDRGSISKPGPNKHKRAVDKNKCRPKLDPSMHNISSQRQQIQANLNILQKVAGSAHRNNQSKQLGKLQVSLNKTTSSISDTASVSHNAANSARKLKRKRRLKQEVHGTVLKKTNGIKDSPGHKYGKLGHQPLAVNNKQNTVSSQSSRKYGSLPHESNRIKDYPSSVSNSTKIPLDSTQDAENSISRRTRQITGNIFTRNGQPIPVFIQFKARNRIELAEEVVLMSGQHLISAPTDESLNFTDVELVEHVSETLRWNAFKFYNTRFIQDCRLQGTLLNVEDYLIYDPAESKVLPRPVDKVDGGSIGFEEEEESDRQKSVAPNRLRTHTVSPALSVHSPTDVTVPNNGLPDFRDKSVDIKNEGDDSFESAWKYPTPPSGLVTFTALDKVAFPNNKTELGKDVEGEGPFTIHDPEEERNEPQALVKANKRSTTPRSASNALESPENYKEVRVFIREVDAAHTRPEDQFVSLSKPSPQFQFWNSERVPRPVRKARIVNSLDDSKTFIAINSKTESVPDIYVAKFVSNAYTIQDDVVIIISRREAERRGIMMKYLWAGLAKIYFKDHRTCCALKKRWSGVLNKKQDSLLEMVRNNPEIANMDVDLGPLVKYWENLM